MGSQVVDEDLSRLAERGTVGEVRGGGGRASDRTKEKMHRFRIESRLHAACHASTLALTMTDEACQEAEI